MQGHPPNATMQPFDGLSNMLNARRRCQRVERPQALQEVIRSFTPAYLVIDEN
jgi:hypothetical protein